MGRLSKGGKKAAMPAKIKQEPSENARKEPKLKDAPKLEAVIVDSVDSSDESSCKTVDNCDIEDEEEEDTKPEAKLTGKGNSVGEKELTSSEESDDCSSNDEEVLPRRGRPRGKVGKEDNKIEKKNKKVATGRGSAKKNSKKDACLKAAIGTDVTNKSGSRKPKQTEPASNVATNGVEEASVRNLLSFGMSPAAHAESRVNSQSNTNTASLRVVVVNGLDGHSDVLLRCEATGTGNVNSCWSEKVFLDAIKEPNSWAKQLNVSMQTFNWYDREVMQVNRNNYPIRLFHIPVAARVVAHSRSVLGLCKYICRMISATPRNTETITAEEGSLTWIEGPVVWSEVVGTTKALSMLRYAKGAVFQGFYEANEEYVLSLFKTNNEVAMKQLFAPETTDAKDANEELVQ